MIAQLKRIVGDAYVVDDPAGLIAFEYDGSVDRALPSAVTLPACTAEVSRVMKAARDHGTTIVARGAGTGLSGGSVPEQGSLVISLTRMNRIIEIDPANQLAVV